MRAVNLLPRQHVEQKRERPNAVALGAGIGGAVVLLALVGGFLLANRSVDRQRQALADARAVLAATPAHHLSAKTQAFRSTLLSQREQRSLALAAALGKRVAWDRILRRVALVLPNDVWLQSLSGTVPPRFGARARDTPRLPSALPPAPTALTIAGLHVLPGRRRAAPRAARGPARPQERPAPEQPGGADRQPDGHQLHDRLRHPQREGEPRDRPPCEPVAEGSGRARRGRAPPRRLVGYFAADRAEALHGRPPEEADGCRAGADRPEQVDGVHAGPAGRARGERLQPGKAMPSQLETPDVILQLNQLAVDSGITSTRSQPGGDLDRHGHDDRLDGPVRRRAHPGPVHGQLLQPPRLPPAAAEPGPGRERKPLTAGRLFDVSDIAFAAGPKGFPQVQATLTINAFVPQTAQPATRRAGQHGHDVDLTTGRDHPDDHHDLESRLQRARARAEGRHEPQEENAGHPGGEGPPREAAGHRRCSPARGRPRLRDAARPRRQQELGDGSRTHDRALRRPARRPRAQRAARGDCLGHRAPRLHSRRRARSCRTPTSRRGSRSRSSTPSPLRRQGSVRPADRYADGFVQHVADGHQRADHVGAGPDHGAPRPRSRRRAARSPAPAPSRSRSTARVETVRIGASFPSSNPVFRLVSRRARRREDRHRQRLLLQRCADRHARGSAGRSRSSTTANGVRYKLRLLSGVVSAAAVIDLRATGRADSRRSSATRRDRPGRAARSRCSC